MSGVLSPRSIVKRAASIAKNRRTREWLTRDEDGAWEKRAATYVYEKKDDAARLGYDDERFATAIARQLVLLALNAQISLATNT
jgi:hypothetical protein